MAALRGGGSLLEGLGRLAGGLAVLPGVAFHPAGGVDELLLAGEEGMAARADFETQLLALGGPRSPVGTARAVNVYRYVLRMDSRFHHALRFRRPDRSWPPDGPTQKGI